MAAIAYRLEMRSLFVACLVACNVPPARPAGPAASAEPSAARIDRITHHLLPAARVKGMDWHRNLEDRMRELHIHGLSIAVFEHHHLAWAKGFGLGDVETRQPVTETTLFQAGSISKAVNALAALEAVEQGKLALDTPINDSLRSWKLGDNDFTRQHAVTLRELLSHTAGTNVHGFLGYRAGAPVPTLVQIEADLRARGETWLRTRRDNNFLLMRIDDVLIRIYRGDPEKPNERALRIGQQLQGRLPGILDADVEATADWVWMLSYESIPMPWNPKDMQSDSGLVASATLCQARSAGFNAETRFAWTRPIGTGDTVLTSITAKPTPPFDPGKPPIKSKTDKRKKKKDDNDGGGDA